MVAAAAHAVQPPDRALGALLRQRLEHGEHRRGADPGADQQDRGIGSIQDERAPWRGDVDAVADGEPGVQVAAGGAVVLALDGDPVGGGTGQSGHRVVAQQRPLARVGLDAHGEVLAGTGGRERRARRVRELDRNDRLRFARDRGDGELPEAGPGGRRLGDAKAGVAAAGPPGRRRASIDSFSFSSEVTLSGLVGRPIAIPKYASVSFVIQRICDSGH